MAPPIPTMMNLRQCVPIIITVFNRLVALRLHSQMNKYCAKDSFLWHIFKRTA